MENAREMVCNAIECIKQRKFLEAEALYREASKLMKETLGDAWQQNDECKKCVRRAEALKAKFMSSIEKSEKVRCHYIAEDSTGNGYESLFSCYLEEDIREVMILETYFQKSFQVHNLIKLLELLVKQCPSLKYIRLDTHVRNKKTAMPEFNGIKEDMRERGINFVVYFIEGKHDRKIILDNKYIIKLDRGLHYFKANNPHISLGLCDLDYRKCFEVDIDICRPQKKVKRRGFMSLCCCC